MSGMEERDRPQPVRPSPVLVHTPRDPFIDFFRRVWRKLKRH
jgi:hypothetical protein